MSNPLEQERKNVSFPIKDLSTYIYETEERFNRVVSTYKAFGEDPILRNDPRDMSRSRLENIIIANQKAHRLHEKFGFNASDHTFFTLDHFDKTMPYVVHLFMFIPCIELLASEDQIKKYLEPARRFEIVGAYAQTELGHGSDVRNLETTATFDPKTDSFILNSPSLTSSKWWPGELGFAANHCICYAKLIIDGKNYGVHGFILQIRDMETNKLLPGIQAGDIGPKIGYHAKDNGYLRLDNIRVPRDALLGRYAEVTKEGKYKRKGNEQAGYAVMMKIRNFITTHCWKMMTMALTIGVRYSIVRTQFPEEENGKERKILDYQLQQEKILNNLANAFGMHAGALKVSEIISENTRRVLEKEDFSLMPDTHAVLAGTKSIYSWEAVDNLELIRQSAGGHGFNSYSGFTGIVAANIVNPTHEGENSVMALQTARYLIKNLGNLAKGQKVPDMVEYMYDIQKISTGKVQCKVANMNDLTLDVLLEIARVRVAYSVFSAARELREQTKEVGAKNAWDKRAGNDLVEATRAHVHYWTYKVFMERVRSSVPNEKLRAVLERLCLVYGLDKAIKYPQSLFEAGYLKPEQFRLLKKKKTLLLDEIRPDAIGLVDAFGYPDNTLNTAIGTYDGNAYENLWKWVHTYNPVNQTDLSDMWNKYVKGMRKIAAPKASL